MVHPVGHGGWCQQQDGQGEQIQIQKEGCSSKGKCPPFHDGQSGVVNLLPGCYTQVGIRLASAVVSCAGHSGCAKITSGHPASKIPAKAGHRLFKKEPDSKESMSLLSLYTASAS